MKPIIIALIVLATTWFTSCSTDLDEIPEDFISRVNFYQNETDALGAIAGAYSSFGIDYYNINYYLLLELHADYIEGRGSQAPISNFSQVLDNAGIGRAATGWSVLYQSINRANAVLDNVPGIENMSDNVKKRIVAEARFIRAMAYFNLVKAWGAVPIRLHEARDLSALAAPREPEEQVYALIVEDLELAQNDLPTSVGAETGRASVGAAKLLLANVYLTLGEWAKAASKAEEVINAGTYALVEVDQPDDFYKIFATQTCSEDIFSVHHSENRFSEIPLYLHRGDTPPYNYSSRGFWAWIPKTNSFIGNSWDDNDMRKPFNLYTKHLDRNGNEVNLPSTSPILFKKFISNRAGLNVYSLPILRYAEAYLVYAEAAALASQSVTPLALERLNVIKRRAYGYPLNTASPVDYASIGDVNAFRNIVLQERGYEFLLEAKRWWDLKRTGKVQEAFQAVGKSYIPERMLLPLPENEINSNPALTHADQNPGY